MAKSYRGGIPFKRKYAPPKEAVAHIPERIFLSFNSGECVVSEGDTVKKYGKLLEKTENSPAAFVGVGGRIEHIYRIGGRTEITLLTSRDAESAPPLETPKGNIADMTEEELRSLLLERGVTPPKKGKREPKRLTVDCGGSLYNDSRLYICRAFPEKIVLGAKIIMKLLGTRSCSFAIPSSDLEAAEGIYQALPKKSEMFGIVLIKDKLPATLPSLTVSSLYNVEISAARDTAEAGYPVVSPLLCLASYEALVEGIPFCSSYLTLAELEGEIDVFSVPFGASLKEVASPRKEERLIRAEKLYGVEISDEVMTEHTEALVLIPSETESEAVTTACVGCRRCFDVCPACISPIDIFTSVRDGKTDLSTAASAAACFECRSCSYVCPSEIPLAETVIRLRRESGFLSVDVGGEDHSDLDNEEAENEQ